MANEAQQQSYDNLLKRFLENQPTMIIPLLFPEMVSQVVEELNVEVLIPPRRTDRVYKSRGIKTSEEDMLILHVEFESSANSNMDRRLLIYHALLLEKYDLPIISMIVYPFEVSMVASPLKETRGTEEILTFHYRTLPLWKLDARIYVEQQAVPVYGLLPAMQGVSDEMLLQAIDEMIQYYQHDEARLREELLCFRVLLTRARRLPEAEMQRVERRIRMFDPLLEEDPWVKEKLTESKTAGMRESIETVVQTRFPALQHLVKERLNRIKNQEMLQQVLVAMSAAADEQKARRYLLALPNEKE